jgi:adiponectin receptor
MTYDVDELSTNCSPGKLTAHQKHLEMQQYPYIKTGYRKSPLPTCETVASIFQVHNETGNIWTHLLGAFYFIYVLFHVWGLDVPKDIKALLLVNVLSYFMCMAFSVSFHTSIAHSYKVAKCGEKCDHCGVSLAIYNGVFTGTYVGF